MDYALTSTGSSPTYNWIASIFEADSGCTMYQVNRIISGSGLSAGTTYYVNSYSGPETTENNVAYTFRVAATAEYLQVYVPTNASTSATTLVSRKNNADGNASISVSSGATGLFEDLTHSDSLASNDKFNLKLTTGTGGGFTIGVLAYAVTQSASAKIDVFHFHLTSLTQGPTTTRYAAVFGYDSGSTETDFDVEQGYSFFASNLRIYVDANSLSTAATTVTTRKNLGAANQSISISAGATGLSEDLSNADFYLDTDTINASVAVASGGSGSMHFKWIGLTEEATPIQYVGSLSNPADNGSANEPGALAITTSGAPFTFLAKDLVAIISEVRAAPPSSAMAISQAGGQSWNAITPSGANSVTIAGFWCEFDGTWDADPSVSFASESGTVPATVVMHVFRPIKLTDSWEIDQTLTVAGYTAPSSPFTVTQNTITNTKTNTITLAIWASGDDNTWGSLSGANWLTAGLDQYRNTAGSDQSISFAYTIRASGSPVSPSKNQTTLGGDAGVKAYISWATASSSASGSAAQTLKHVVQSASGYMRPSGTGAQSLPKLSQSGTGVMHPRGTAAQMLPSIDQSAAGAERFTATSAQTLASIDQSDAGAERFTATSAQTLKHVIQAGGGLEHPRGSAAQALPSIDQSAAGTERFTATSAQTLKHVTQAGTGGEHSRGAATQTLPSIDEAAGGTSGNLVTASASQALPSIDLLAVGAERFTAVSAQTLPSIDQAAAGAERLTATSAQQLKHVTESASGIERPQGLAAQALPSIDQSAIGAERLVATSGQLLKHMTQSGTGIEQPGGSAAETLPSIDQSATGGELFTAASVQTLKHVMQSAGGVLSIGGAGQNHLAAIVQSAGGLELVIGTAAQLLAKLRQEAYGVQSGEPIPVDPNYLIVAPARVRFAEAAYARAFTPKGPLRSLTPS